LRSAINFEMKKNFTFPFFILVVLLLSIAAISCKTEKNKTISDTATTSEISHPTQQADTSDYTFPNINKNSCLTCHGGIEHIRDPKSGMMQEIYKLAGKAGFEDNECIVCHGGNPNANDKFLAHSGSIEYFILNDGPGQFYPDPASVWINEETCGMCHQEQVSTQFTSLMFTEAGKIQGTTWGFGGLQGYNHNVANVAVAEVDVHNRLGSDTYKKYIEELKIAEPQVFPKTMKGLPDVPTPEELEENPALSVYSYLRTDCQRCHTGVKGSNAAGDFRGTGCGSCHIPYSNKGLYEGKDTTIVKSKKGKFLVHSIQSTRDSKVTVNGKSYTGIPTKTCTSCHNRGRRIGVSYEGLMETSYSSPFMSNGDNQQKIHKKNYIHLHSDVHLKKGMLCQDCHTSGDMHSLGDLTGAIQAAVEIECQDCHGTPQYFPWELPIGYGDEITSTSPKQGTGRGVSQSIPDYLKKGSIHDKREGYLISSRGNPMPYIVKNGDSITLYSAGGKDITLNPIKKLTSKKLLSQKANVSMAQINTHIDKMECYSCHASWAPQCYGCHINIDYSNPKHKIDWVKVAENPQTNGQTVDALSESDFENIREYLVSGEISEQRSYLRWEDPPLVVNGDHRISPAIPGCQTTVTVTDENGNVKLLNHIFKIPNVEGRGKDGQLAIDISPLNPHTVQLEARNCESCHSNPKAMGYGIGGGKFYYRPDTNFVMDLLDAFGNPIAQQVDTQFNAIPNLKMDWSRFIDEENNQLQTVGHHLSGSRPLNKSELQKLDRRGVCLSCHKTIPDKDLASNLLSHVAKYAGVEIDNEKHAVILQKSIRLSAWVQVLLPVLLLSAFVIIFWWRRRNKSGR